MYVLKGSSALRILCAGAACFAAALNAQPQQQPAADLDLGYSDTPILPGQKWHVHDWARQDGRVGVPQVEVRGRLLLRLRIQRGREACRAGAENPKRARSF